LDVISFGVAIDVASMKQFWFDWGAAYSCAAHIRADWTLGPALRWRVGQCRRPSSTKELAASPNRYVEYHERSIGTGRRSACLTRVCRLSATRCIKVTDLPHTSSISVGRSARFSKKRFLLSRDVALTPTRDRLLRSHTGVMNHRIPQASCLT